MSKLKLTKRVLYKEAKPVSFDYPVQLTKLRKQLTSIMLMKDGIGLAAPQVGVSKQVFVMRKLDVNKTPSIVGVFNPDILEYDKDVIPFIEGCLSFPVKSLEVNRPASILATWKDETGKEYEEELHGMNARIFQHEFDHLYGVTFEERV